MSGQHLARRGSVEFVHAEWGLAHPFEHYSGGCPTLSAPAVGALGWECAQRDDADYSGLASPGSGSVSAD